MKLYKERTFKVSMTMKYPDETRFGYSNLMLSATDENLLDIAEAMNSLQSDAHSEVIRTETSNLYFEV